MSAGVVLRYWAAAKAAAGVAEESFTAGTLAELVDAAGARHGPSLPAVLARCSYLVDEVPVGTRAWASVWLPDGAVVEALPPFAGG
ncbi:MAG: MoaD/ThiS family protein [Actinomycetes bacterium]